MITSNSNLPVTRDENPESKTRLRQILFGAQHPIFLVVFDHLDSTAQMVHLRRSAHFTE